MRGGVLLRRAASRCDELHLTLALTPALALTLTRRSTADLTLALTPDLALTLTPALAPN